MSSLELSHEFLIGLVELGFFRGDSCFVCRSESLGDWVHLNTKRIMEVEVCFGGVFQNAK